MRFTLSYSGRLPSTGDAAAKHKIRRALHPQLKELWATHPALISQSKWITRSEQPGSDDGAALLESVEDNDFAVLVHPELRLYAELDILVLRPESPGAVITKSGDLDNQLKTLFDALRRPLDKGEVPTSWTPLPEEKPLFCLLYDDKLITKVRVEADRLLDSSADPKDVVLFIRVEIKGSTATWGNIGLIS